jgi:cell wall-associated NlpC family hydrolase
MAAVPNTTAVEGVMLKDGANHSQVRSQLLQQLAEWKGVPHRDGGLSKQGVDCSGFVYLTFADEFGIRIPRTTQSQVLKGVVVEQSDLIPGDLVFFQTGIKQRHVGIYVGDNQFIHTSSSRGVMTSRLDNPYWQDAYWHSRRLVDLN